MDPSTIKDVSELKETVQNLDEGVLESWFKSMLPDFISFVVCVILSILIWVIGMKLIKWLIRLFDRGMERKNVDVGVRHFLGQLFHLIGYVVLLLVILNLFGIQTPSIAAAIASLGVTVGLAMQGSLSNLAGGILILLMKPFVVGDYIVEDTHQNEGEVISITILYTKLKTIDNQIVVIPNGVLANSSLTNKNGSDRRFINLIYPISYHDDIQKAKEILRTIAENDPNHILLGKKDPEICKPENIKVFVAELGDSAIQLGVRYWIPGDKYWDSRWRFNESVKIQFDQAGITIPFQTMNVHVAEDKQ